MLRALLCAVPVLAFLAGGSPAADEKPDHAGVNGVVVKVDAANHAVTVRVQDAEGKEVEKTYRLSGDAHVTDESGKAVGLDGLEAGAAVNLVERAGRLIELHRAGRKAVGRSTWIASWRTMTATRTVSSSATNCRVVCATPSIRWT